MSDSQLRQTINQLSNAANFGGQYQQTYAAPTPAPATPTPQQSSSSNLAPTPRTPTPIAPAPITASQPQYQQPIQYQQQQTQQTSYYVPPPAPAPPPRPSSHDGRLRTTVPTATQALHSTYASRLRTGTTLLVQPILNNTSLAAHVAATGTSSGRPRRGNVVSYADPGSGDDIPDAGEVDSDGSDFVASGGTRTALRTQRTQRGLTGTPVQSARERERDRDGRGTELDQSYLGLVPPGRFITSKKVYPTLHENFSQDSMQEQSRLPSALVPIRVEFETDTHRIRDCFVWNLHEKLVTPESFARTFCTDLDIPHAPWVETVATQIRAQLEEMEGVGGMDLAVDVLADMDVDGEETYRADEVPECRVVLAIDVQVDNHHLTDHIEWDLRSPLTPEDFTRQLCLDLGLSGEAIPLIAHAIHEELIKHKRDAIEWGVIDSAASNNAALANHNQPQDAMTKEQRDKERDRSGAGLLKDKTGLGLGWGRAPKQGRGPQVLRSVWRDWQEAEEFGTRWEELTAEEVERREIERERATRRLRRETSKFQSSTRTRRR
ncbi:SNF5-domain-containing protein [Stereum hirsutum FP-91666 SS1]|uniref:SNF5-domain-containing protein n=1 Tax=Stereum hirsutum (strain FP-91666) TaxID=721885 RepID=UPI0004449B57|nr:SNF5-domain-containing protein [Stereum hirsutum FP-91666 SS1]EIM81753.1 SNF5-domain-containing protein [Stereum hirsutum FP-91666 SS1]